MHHFKTISEYCKAIGISNPKHPHFDIRSFEENMGKVVSQMPPFRHEFYSIAIKANGGGKAITGHHTDFPEGVTIFFNSPFQILSWDIVPDWSGYYIMISQDFLASSHHFDRLLEDFPFLKIDESIPFEINQNELPEILRIFKRIQEEYQSENDDKFAFIHSYLILLLNQVKRLFTKQVDAKTASEQFRSADLKLLSRFQKLVKISFYPDAKTETFANLHSPTYYAQVLSVHPNHLNAVVKSITGKTALNHIHHHILKLAKAELLQTTASVKEIAYSLHFESPNNFSAFFKKNTGVTPLSYRKNQ
ncbi:AraC family transcriptional regulator [Marinifilum caeruleilacunae]|uniref:AraC family transcriptional regulator n=1 Tax=Marinifilum caeruleilacunae TaxID=2499076 RepID=A0ABX1WQE6_9BACT|nr:helix-turn-helix domain-containing protein [Marinifilum caeruleilacunae]NOU58305.1 AraC family transcriptional regulator [Marinifilum caeruleilacunae]